MLPIQNRTQLLRIIKKKEIASKVKQRKLGAIDREINNVNNKINEVKATISTLKSKVGDFYDAAEETNAERDKC